MSAPGEIRVPAGHKVQIVKGTLAPSVHRLDGGLLIASTGLAGDDSLAEIPELLSQLERMVTPCKVVVAAGEGELADLFAPARPPTETLESAAVVLFQKGSLAGWTGEDLSGLAIRLRDLAQRTTLIVCVEPSSELRRIKLRFESAGLELRLPTPDGAVAFEVHRPDRTILTGVIAPPLHARALEDAAGADADADSVLGRSPRLNALLLAHVRAESAQTRRAIEEHLEARTAPFVLIARQGGDGQYGIAPRDFGGRQALVAYGDERALHGAARALGIAPESYAIAGMPPRSLFAWAASLSVPLMLCAYEDPADLTSQVWHVPLEGEVLRRLAGPAS
jgi:hypothetical protein